MGGIVEGFGEGISSVLGIGKKKDPDLTDLLNQQSAQAADLKKDLQQQPKTIAPDNFLADRNSMLKQIRSGLASTIMGLPGQAPALAEPNPADAWAKKKAKLGQ